MPTLMPYVFLHEEGSDEPVTIRRFLEEVASSYGMELDELLAKELVSLEVTRFTWRNPS